MFDYNSSFIENKMKIQIFITFIFFAMVFPLQQSAHVLEFLFNIKKHLPKKKKYKQKWIFSSFFYATILKLHT